jgi:hypothetical protein
LVKDILALANTGGGWLVIGVSETGVAFSPDGVSEEQAASFETTQVNKFLNNYADPPINTRIHKPEVKGKRFVAIGIPGFSDTPHICQKEYPGVLTAPTLYVRTDNNESAPIKNSADFRAVIERATRNRADQILESVRAVITHGVQEQRPSDREQFEAQVAEARKRCDEKNPYRDKDYGYRESVFYPASFDPGRFDLPTLKAMALNAYADFRGWPFLFATQARPDWITAIQDGHESMIKEQHGVDGIDDVHFWQLRQSGLLYVRQLLREDAYRAAHGGNLFLNFESFSIVAFEAVHCLVKLYEGRLEDSEDVALRFCLTGTQDRELESYGWHYRHYMCRIPDVTYAKTLSLGDWRAGMIDHGIAICEHVFHRFNWGEPNLSESRVLMEKAMKRSL